MRKFIGIFASLIVLKSAAWANPQNPTVIDGSANFDSNGTLLKVMAEDRTIISWDSFSIEQAETTIFTLPDEASTVLNRVASTFPSTIAGALQSNGQVYLINQNGILVTSNGVINTAGFLASTLDVPDSDFLARGDLLFTAAMQSEVVNHGTIITWNGDLILLGYKVVSDQSLTAQNGVAAMGAGESILLTPASTEKISIQISSSAMPMGTGVDFSGQLTALQAELKAHGNLYALAIQSEGIIQATSNQTMQGRVYLVAPGGTVNVSGYIDATGFNTPGGEIQVLGETVILADKATLNASGDTGGGTILIGGSFQGRDPSILNAQHTFIDSNVKIFSRASGDFGNGGEVVVWSDGETFFYGSIIADAGPFGGDGGNIEVSGFNYLDFQGTATTAALSGMTGTLLLDPSDLDINNNPETAIYNMAPCGANTYCGGAANSATINITNLLAHLLVNNVIIDSSQGSGIGSGAVNLQADLIVPAGSNDLTINAYATFTNTGKIVNNGSSAININTGIGTAGTVLIYADITNAGSGSINIHSGIAFSSNISIAPGSITVSNTGSGNLAMTAGSSTSITGIIAGDSSTILSNSGSGNMSLTATSSAFSTAVQINYSVSHTSSGTFQINALQGHINFFSGSSFNIGAGAGAVTLSSSGSQGVVLGGTIDSAASSDFQVLASNGTISMNTGPFNFTGGSPILIQTSSANAINLSNMSMNFSGAGGSLTVSSGGSVTYSGLILNYFYDGDFQTSSISNIAVSGATSMVFKTGAGNVVFSAPQNNISFSTTSTALAFNTNAGNLTITAGTLGMFNGAITAPKITFNSGAGKSIAMTANGNITLDNIIYNSTGDASITTTNGGITLGSASSLNWGSTTAAGNLSMNASTSISISGNITFSSLAGTSPTALSMNASNSVSLNNTSTVSYSSPFDWIITTPASATPNYTFAGSITLQPGSGRFLATTANNSISTTGSINNHGTALVQFLTTGTGTITTSSASVLLFDNGAPMTMQADSSITLGGNRTFTGGAGPLQILAGTQVSITGGTFTYSDSMPAVITASSGALILGGSSNISGAGGLLLSSSGNLTVNGTVAYTSTGALSMSATSPSNVTISSPINMNASAPLILSAGTINIFNKVINSGTGIMTVTATSDLILGNPDSVVNCQLGSAGGDVTLTIGRDVILQSFGEMLLSTTCQVGYDIGNVSSNITFNSIGRNLTLIAGPAPFCYVVIGHGSQQTGSTGGARTGNISFGPIGGSVRMQGYPTPPEFGTNAHSFAQIGHLGSLTGTPVIVTGNIDLSQITGSATLRGANSLGCYALIGHGSASSPQSDSFSGNIAVHTGGQISIESGTATDAFAGIGHAAFLTAPGTVTLQSDLIEAIAGATGIVKADSGAEAFIGMYVKATAVGGAGSIGAITPMMLPTVNVQTTNELSLTGATPSDEFNGALIGLLSYTGTVPFVAAGNAGGVVNVTTGGDFFIQSGFGGSNNNTFAYVMNGIGSPPAAAYDVATHVTGELIMFAGNADTGILSIGTQAITTTGLLTMQSSASGQVVVSSIGDMNIQVGSMDMNTSSSGLFSTIETTAGNLTIVSGPANLFFNGIIDSAGTLDMTLSGDLFIQDGSAISSVNAYSIDVTGSLNLLSAASVIITGTSTGDVTATDNIFVLADSRGSAQITSSGILNVSSTGGSIYLIGASRQAASINTLGSTITVVADESVSLINGGSILVNGGSSDLTVTAMNGTLLLDDSSRINNFGTGFLNISGSDLIVRGMSNVILTGSGAFTLNAAFGNLIIENGARIQNFGTAGLNSTVSGSLFINGGPLGESSLFAGTGGLALSANEITMSGSSAATQAIITAQGGPFNITSTLSISLDAFSRIALTGGSSSYQVSAGTSFNISNTSMLQNLGSGMTTITAGDFLSFLEGSSMQGSSGALTLQSMGDVKFIDGSFINTPGNVSILASDNILLTSSSFVQTTSGILTVQSTSGNIDFETGSFAKISGGSATLTVNAVSGNINLDNGSFIQNNGTGAVAATAGVNSTIRAGNAGPSFISGKNDLTVNVSGVFLVEASSSGRSYLSCPGIGSVNAGKLRMIGFSSINPALIQDTLGALTVQAGGIYLENFAQIITAGGSSALIINATSGDLHIVNSSLIQNMGIGAIQSTVSGNIYMNGGPSGSCKIQSGNGDIDLSAVEINLNGYSSSFNAMITSARGNLTVASALSTFLNKFAQITLTNSGGTGTLELDVGGNLLVADNALIQNSGTGVLILNVTEGINLFAGAGSAIIQSSAGSIQITANDPIHLAADLGGFVLIQASGNVSVSSMSDIFLTGSSGSSNTASIKTTSGPLTLLCDNLVMRDKAALVITTGTATLAVNTGGDITLENSSSIVHSGAGALNCTASGNLVINSGTSGSSFISNNSIMNLMITEDIRIESTNGFSAYTSSKGVTTITAATVNMNGVSAASPAQIKNATGALTINAVHGNLVNFGQILLSGAGALTVNTTGDLRLTNGSLIAQQGTGNTSASSNRIFIEGGPLGTAALTAAGNMSVNALEVFLTGFSLTNGAVISSSQGSLTVSVTGNASLNPFAKISLDSGPLPYSLTVGEDLLVANGSSLQRAGSGTMSISILGSASLIGGALDSFISCNTGTLTVAVSGMLRLLSDIQGKAFITSAGNASISSGKDVILLGALEAALQAYIQTSAGTLSVTASDNIKLYDLGLINITAGAGTLIVNTTNGDLFLENGSSIQQKGSGPVQMTIGGNASVKAGWAGSSFITSGSALSLDIAEDFVVEASSGFSASITSKGVTSITSGRLMMDGFSSSYPANITNTTGNLTVSSGSMNLLNFSNIRLSGGSGILQVDATSGAARIANGSFLQNQGTGAFNVNVNERLFLTGGAAGAASILGGSSGVIVIADSILMGGATNANQALISSSLGTLNVTTTGMLNMTPFSKIQLTSGSNNVDISVGGTLYRADNTTISTLGTGMVDIMASSTVICHP